MKEGMKEGRKEVGWAERSEAGRGGGAGGSHHPSLQEPIVTTLMP